ncbi:hypothetical protein RRG08_019576 [Elysia crispata]|uniref:Uncharacterized protein n=1 Tax=Elysia crispata TaxID=231223 RepID=A0AAE0YQJ8_9GAST|nr:hypothetical protein RRG08_019576 [Elysia crispata]
MVEAHSASRHVPVNARLGEGELQPPTENHLLPQFLLLGESRLLTESSTDHHTDCATDSLNSGRDRSFFSTHTTAQIYVGRNSRISVLILGHDSLLNDQSFDVEHWRFIPCTAKLHSKQSLEPTTTNTPTSPSSFFSCLCCRPKSSSDLLAHGSYSGGVSLSVCLLVCSASQLKVQSWRPADSECRLL